MTRGPPSNVLMKVKFGSHLYGTSTPSWDIDFKSVFVPPAREILLQRVRDTITNQRPNLIVITDEQSQDGAVDPVAKLAYMINVASNKNGIGYGRWTHIDGFSESIFSFIRENEAA